MNRGTRWLFLCLAWAMVPALAEEVYRWTDAEGVVHYTAMPPPAGQQGEKMKVEGSKGSPAAPARPAPQTAAEPAADAKAEAKAAEQRAYEEHQRAQCANARVIIERLETRPAASYRREDGSYQRYSDEEREQKIAEARDFERRYCN
jgi:Domain of unknown function (DUF4124)